MDEGTEAPKAPRRLAGADVVLKAPSSLAERWDVAILAETPGARERAMAAALGICWPRFRRRHPYPGNALQYGGAVIDALLEQGARMREILSAGVEAYQLCIDGLVPVEGAEGFSGPPAEQDGAASGG